MFGKRRNRSKSRTPKPAISELHIVENASVHTADADELARALRTIAQLVTAARRLTSNSELFTSGTSDSTDRLKFRLEYLSDVVNQSIVDNGMTSPDLVGRTFSPTLAIDPINLDDFNDVENVVITEVIDPLILRGNVTIQRGRVRVARDASGNEGAKG